MDCSHLTKADCRHRARMLRRNLALAEMAEPMMNHLLNWTVFHRAQTVLLFHPLPDEVNLLPLTARYPNKQWLLPRVADDQLLHLHVYHHGDSLTPHRFGMLEPTLESTEFLFSAPIDLCLIPALMADYSGFRLGYGKGYYDRLVAYLRELPHTTITVGVVPEALLVHHLPVDSWDQPLDWVLTEKQLLSIQTQPGPLTA